MTDSTLEHFSKTLHEAAKLSGTTVYTITRPIYLNMCEALNLNGWTKEQIQAYGKGWSGLRKDALKELKNHVEDKSIFAIKKEPVTEEPSNESNEDTGSDFINGIQNERDALLGAYNRFVKTYKYAPNLATFRNYYGSIPKYIYNNIFELDEDYRCLFNSDAEQNLFDRHSWTEEYQKAFREEVKKHKTFVLTSIGSFCDVDWDFIHSLENYAKENNAMIIGLPLFRRYGKSIMDFSTDNKLRQSLWIPFEDVILNNNLMVQVIKANCTTKSTITGLNQMVAKYNSSIIVAGINQQLRYIPVLKDKTPNMIASTGCATYYTPIQRDKTPYNQIRK